VYDATGLRQEINVHTSGLNITTFTTTTTSVETQHRLEITPPPQTYMYIMSKQC